jgi:hypothetical protein
VRCDECDTEWDTDLDPPECDDDGHEHVPGRVAATTYIVRPVWPDRVQGVHVTVSLDVVQQLVATCLRAGALSVKVDWAAPSEGPAIDVDWEALAVKP